jgi:hypothetical protein
MKKPRIINLSTTTSRHVGFYYHEFMAPHPIITGFG